MTARRLTLLLVLLLTGILAGCNLGGEPEQVKHSSRPQRLPPRARNRQPERLPTGVAVTTLPILTPGCSRRRSHLSRRPR